jgi:hypothetical protein
MKIFKKIKKNRGFVILFAVTLAAILLSIAIGVTNIALKEIKFGTSAKDTNEAFFAADTGIECAMFNNKSTGVVFIDPPSSTSIICNNSSINVIENQLSVWTFTIIGLGNTGQGCAKVVVDKRPPVPPITATTTIIAKGYNNGGSTCVSGTNTIERELKTSY